jgi:peptide/nickel transport system substrate-binding protein
MIRRIDRSLRRGIPPGAAIVRRLLLGVFVLSALSACATAEVAPTITPQPTRTVTPPAPTATARPTLIPQTLSVCTREPPAASPFYPSQAGSDILALFYEAPLERVDGVWIPRLVTHVPSLTSGDVVTELARVSTGTRYVDLAGEVRLHEEAAPRELPRMIVTFTLQSDLRWSDGAAITAQDAVLGYHFAQSEYAGGRWRLLAERTARFTAVDALTLRWEGLPGYIESDAPGLLFPPQPSQRWQGRALPEVYEDRTPPASGPFKIVAWESGREVRLVPNPHYNGTPPTLSAITVRFPRNDPSQWTGLVRSGACDVVLPDPAVVTEWRQWANLGRAGEAVIWADTAPNVLRLDFNLDPVSGDPTPLADPAVRRAIGHCIDREGLTLSLPSEALTVAEALVPPDHPDYPFIRGESGMPPYDPEAGKAMLAELGWEDRDDDGVREAEDVPDIRDGTLLSFTIHLPVQSFVTAAHIAGNMEACGIRLSLAPGDVRQLFTPSAESPLFGRTFDLALFGWQSDVPDICGSWLSSRMPTGENAWVGDNFSGYQSEAYDRACRRALLALDPKVQREALRRAQREFAAAPPTLLLVWRPFWFVTRPEVRGLRPDSQVYGTLWNSEEIYKDAGPIQAK